MRRLPQGVAVFALVVTSVAQSPQDGWVFGLGTAGLLVVLDRNFASIGSPPAAGPGADYSVDSGWQIWELSSRNGGALYYRHFTPPTATQQLGMPTSAWFITHDRRRVWLLRPDGTLGSITKTNLTAQTETPAGNVRTALGLTELVGSMTSNGRDLFFCIKVTANDSHHIFAVDTQAPLLTVRPVAAMPLGGYDPLGPDLTIGRDGKLLASYFGAMWSIDPETGAVQQLFLQPAHPYFGGAKVLIAYDPWVDEMATAPEGPYNTFLYSCTVAQGAWQPRFGLMFAGPMNLACAAERPFELYGRGCNNNTNRDPRLGWSGMPQPGGSFSIRLRDAEPGGVAWTWLGWSDAAWGSVGSLPFDLGPYGAPNCRILASADAVVLMPVDALGRATATYGVPPVAALVGADLFGQTMSSTSANALGLATSDAVMIRVR